ncbi:WxL domain-containing protein [Enterococcus pernyi]|uniref:WxL domain-containing protein n=1 Tax=Enterococcus pernyi TaxID=590158 RepID=UPI000789BEAB|nr:WxL domain-containing protein [Enterococcus pernyi]
MMLGRTQLSGTTLRNLDAFSESWHSLDAHLTGVNGSVVRSSTSDPADFSERYLMNFGQSKYRSLISSATTGEGFDPPVSSYNLTLQTSPSEGGNPEVERTSLQQGATTTISANPNKGYTFSHWELVSGIGSSIASVISETTSFTMGTQNTVVRAIYEEEQEAKVHVYHTDMEGHELIEPVILTGSIGKTYQTSPIEFEHYQLIETPDNANGHFEEETISVVYTYDIENVNPLDPLDPEAEVEPENHPELPESQGLLSIDFVSQFNFGSQGISLHNQTYYAQPQRLLNEDGTVKEKEERPNYVQISDRRPDNERSGWQLSVTQNGQFSNQSGHELIGSEIQLLNQELVTAQGGTAPTLQEKTAQRIIPNTKKILLLADKESGTGTWIYRFGDQQTADKSVGLYIPKGTNPEATSYSTKLTWELSAVPDN